MAINVAQRQESEFSAFLRRRQTRRTPAANIRGRGPIGVDAKNGKIVFSARRDIEIWQLIIQITLKEEWKCTTL